MIVANPESFRAEAKFQVVCAYCGKARPFQAHHVVDRAELSKRGIKGNAQYDTRNALRLCEDISRGIEGRCHYQFENRRIELPCVRLKDQNVVYAFEVLGAYAYDYLGKEYADVDADPRIELQMEAIARGR